MQPFRKLLSSKIPFTWSEELEVAFKKSKEEIINQCSQGIRSFVPGAPTALATDWSKLAVGCWLTQIVNVQQIFPDVAQMGGRQFSFRASSILKPHPIIIP